VSQGFPEFWSNNDHHFIIVHLLREPHEDSFGQEKPMVTLIVPEKTGRNAAVAAATVLRTQRPAPKWGRKGLWMLAGLAVALCLASTTPARATVTRIPWEYTAHACPVFPEESGEAIPITGRCVIVTTVTSTPSGGYQAHSVDQCHGTGVGQTTGTNFIFNDGGTFNFGTNGTTVTGTQVRNVQLISQGSAPDQRIQYTFHATINSNGDVAVFFDNFKSVCQ
jgi:hypothetical protein